MSFNFLIFRFFLFFSNFFVSDDQLKEKSFKCMNLSHFKMWDFEMGIPVEMKTYTIESKVGDSLKVRIEKIGRGGKTDILYRIIRGEDRRSLSPDKVVLFKEELQKISEFLNEEFLKKEFPE